MIVDQETVIDLVDTNEELGELVKFGAICGYEIHVEAPRQDNVEGKQVRFSWPYGADDWGSTQFANMAMLTAYAQGLSGDDLLARLRAEMVRRCYSMDKPLQDVMSIGSGHDGHGHDDA